MEGDSEDNSQRLVWLALGFCSALLFYVITRPMPTPNDTSRDVVDENQSLLSLISIVGPLSSIVLVGVWTLLDASIVAVVLSGIQTQLAEGDVVYYFQGPLRLAIVGSMVYIIAFQFGEFVGRRSKLGQV